MRKLRRSKFPWRQEGNQEMGLSERRGEKTTVSSRTHCGRDRKDEDLKEPTELTRLHRQHLEAGGT